MPITLNGSSGILGGINSTASQALVGTTGATFTGIPSTAKRITIIVINAQNGSAPQQRVQIGSGGLSTSGYTGANSLINGGTGQNALSACAGFGYSGGLTTVAHGQYVLTNVVGTNTWSCSGTFCYDPSAGAWGSVSGYITLAGALDRVAFNGSAGTFSSGTVQVYYE